MTLWEDVKEADWTDPEQWAHACGFVACRVLHGKGCDHIGSLGTFTERWPEAMIIPWVTTPLVIGFLIGRWSKR